MVEETLAQVKNLRKFFPVIKGVVLTKIVGWVRAVDNVSFDVHRGQTLAIVGESGCGKTTVAKLVLRLEDPTEGSVSVGGKEIHALKGEALRHYRMDVQAVFQDPWSSLSPRMHVREIVAEPIAVNRNIGSSELNERVSSILRDVGLRPDHANLYPHEFSGGQRQRIALASALISEPRLIVLDEPVSSLDVSIQAQILNLLKDLQAKNGVSYLMIAHNLATVRYLADQVAVMYLGQIVEAASTEKIYQRPLHPYTRALFSASLPAHPGVQREEIVLQGEVPSPLNPPAGCRFHTRCPHAMEVCFQIEPVKKEVEPGHIVACHLY